MTGGVAGGVAGWSAGRLSVLVVDDHPVVRRGLVALLGAVDELVVAGEAATAQEAVDLARRLAPELVVLDLELPGRSGLAAAAELRALPQPPGVLVLTMHDDVDSCEAALRAGARGYLLKDGPVEELLAAVRTVAAGGVVVTGSLRDVDPRLLTGSHPCAPFPQLTPRERDVLRCAARGMGGASTAAELGLAPKTVANHLSSVLVKLGVATREEAAARARRAGLAEDPVGRTGPGAGAR
ncbi:response regulator [Quadrisphaera oryzae]|uniref:response regulator n=1 Tax=Quadrisphaera TaxID=317661 RepID=UPI00164648FB|nr:response regulator transcription factor [Quadrisphaera sp. RL12-1S]MBC3763465.1 response regulator transcription factor [Quadrisphaera sp. RL12-1S]